MTDSDGAISELPGERASVKSAAYEKFRHALFDGRLRPGQFVSQRELVALLGLSIGALRELLDLEDLLVPPKLGFSPPERH